MQNTKNQVRVKPSKSVTYENITYGMLVEVINESGFHAGCKVHFFNKKGALIGNYYEFMPYYMLRRRAGYVKTGDMDYPLFFYGKRFQKVKEFLFIRLLKIISSLIRFAERYLD